MKATIHNYLNNTKTTLDIPDNLAVNSDTSYFITLIDDSMLFPIFKGLEVRAGGTTRIIEDNCDVIPCVKLGIPNPNDLMAFGSLVGTVEFSNIPNVNISWKKSG